MRAVGDLACRHGIGHDHTLGRRGTKVGHPHVVDGVVTDRQRVDRVILVDKKIDNRVRNGRIDEGRVVGGLVSVVVVETATSLCSAVPRVAGFGRTTTVKVCWAPLAMVPTLQIRLLLPGPVVEFAAGAVPQAPAEGLAEMKATFAGRVSVMVTASAAESPLASFRAAMT